MGAKCSKGVNMGEYGNIPKKKKQDGVDDEEEEEDELKIPEVKNGMSINELIGEVNDVISQWTDTYQPISDAADAAKKPCGMEKKKEAGIKQCMLGLAVAMVANGEDLKKSINFVEESPFIEINAEERWVEVFDKIKEWINAYIETGPRCQEFIEKLAEFPEKAANIGANVKDEIENSDLGTFEKLKVVKNTLSAVSKIKSVVAKLLEEIKGVPEELKNIKDTAEELKAGIEDGSIKSKGEEAKEKQITSICPCYELSYGKLK